MIPPPHTTNQGRKVLFIIFGVLTLGLWIAASIEQGEPQSWGMFAMGVGFFALAWLQKWVR
jgi:hypothetical protein